MEKAKRHSNPSLVVKSNQLINSRYNLSITEMRLFLMMIAQVERDDSDFKSYRIKIKDFAEAVGSSFKDYYKTAEQSSKQLLGRVLEIPTANGNLLQVSFLSSAEYFRGEGVVELSFDPKLKPYLLELKDRYTSYDIRNVLRLQSTHSMRIYELLKQFESVGKRTFEIVELKRILSIETQYKRYNDFKRYVILQARKELSEHCDITFDFQEKKKGRKIISICFIIIQQDRVVVNASDSEKDNAAQRKEVFALLCDLGLSEQQALRYTRAKEHGYLRRTVEYVKKGFEAGKIKNPAAYFIKLVEQDAETIVPIHIKESKKRAAKQGRGKSPAAPRDTTRQLLAQLEKEFERVRQRQVQELIKNASKEDWASFEKYIASVPYLKSRFFEEGVFQRNHKDLQSWLGIFLADENLMDKEQAFIDWAASRGVKLEKDEQEGFKVVFRQGNLFGEEPA